MTNNLIIHIAGPSGSGKTTLGKKLQQIHGATITVIDTDDLSREYSNSLEKSNSVDFMDGYQEYIYKYIRENSSKPIIFVGLINSPTHVLDLKADYKFFIEIALEQNLKQKFFRSVDYMYNKKENLFNQYLANPDNLQKRLFYFVDFNKWKEEFTNDKKIYDKYDYIFESPDEIIGKIGKILDNQRGGKISDDNIYNLKYKKYKSKYLKLRDAIELLHN